MRRAFFFAIGIFVFLLGAQCLAVDKFVLKSRLPPPPPKNTWLSGDQPKVGPNRELVPPDWAPWTLMSTGAVVCLYSYTVYRSPPPK